MNELLNNFSDPHQDLSDFTAVVLAGGQGSRLKPYTTVLPKPLMPVGDIPILEIVLRQLKVSGFRRVLLAVNHQAALIKTYFGNGDTWGIDLIYQQEKTPLGTIGPLHLMADQLPDTFLVMNGDILTDFDYASFMHVHNSHPEHLTVAVCSRKQNIDYGVIELSDDRKRAVGFKEKPTLDLWVSAGIYAMNKDVLHFVPEGVPFGFDQLMFTMLNARLPIATHVHTGQWHDIGRSEDLEAAVRSYESNRDRYLRVTAREKTDARLCGIT